MKRSHWLDASARLDADTDFVEIYRQVVAYEFPWDMNQALSFALFRTYAVPSIGRLLDQTGEFQNRTQKRYDDTALILETPGRYGFDHPESRAAIRRMNQMHKAYDISNDNMRYVLSTFVVTPVRWLEKYGKRRMTEHEIKASVNYYRELGRHMNISDIPGSYREFAGLLDSYEAQHFGYDEGSRRVADATLKLLLTFYPAVAAKPVEAFSRALMDPPLRESLGYAAPPAFVQWASHAALRARGRLLRWAPARKTAKNVIDLPYVRSYPNGYDVEELGTFPGSRCPV